LAFLLAELTVLLIEAGLFATLYFREFVEVTK